MKMHKEKVLLFEGFVDLHFRLLHLLLFLNRFILLHDNICNLLNIQRGNPSSKLSNKHLGLFMKLIKFSKGVLRYNSLAAMNEPAVTFIREKDNMLGVMDGENQRCGGGTNTL